MAETHTKSKARTHICFMHTPSRMRQATDRGTRRKIEIYQRVDQAFNEAGITTQTARAKICGVDQPTISKWKTGKHSPTLQNLLDISAATGHEVTWLARGVGRRLIQPEDPLSDQVIRLLNSSDEGTRRRFLAVAQALSAEREE